MIRRLAAAMAPLLLLLAACSGGDGGDEDAGTGDVATLERNATDDDLDTSDEAGSDADESSVTDGSETTADATEGAAETTTTAAPTTTTAAPGQDDQDVLNDFSECMRGEGLDDFPDLALGIGGIQEILDAGINPLGREFTTALGECSDLLEPIQQSPTEMSPEERITAEQALLAGSVCMRNKGIANFPDPDFTAGMDQRAYVTGILAAGLNPLDPEFLQYADECQSEIAEEFDLQLDGNGN